MTRRPPRDALADILTLAGWGCGGAMLVYLVRGEWIATAVTAVAGYALLWLRDQLL